MGLAKAAFTQSQRLYKDRLKEGFAILPSCSYIPVKAAQNVLPVLLCPFPPSAQVLELKQTFGSEISREHVLVLPCT